MHRSFLIFAVAFVALMAGVLLYVARVPVEHAKMAESAVPDAAVNSNGPDIVQYPAFTLNDLDGNARAFSEFDGRNRLLNFWATWCAPCRREIPVLKAFQAEQGDDGVLVMGIAVDFADAVANYAAAAQFNYPILIGEEDAMAVAESSGISFIAMPFTMIIARDGEYLGAYLGELHREKLDDISNILTQLDAGQITKDSAKGAFELL
ncbi:MAG TPA: TlpA disulfide reductase family protein [Woeseiaceae bacterium]|nr:TlpA disulfide reductase family protein [Woeseiaceae bacterium]